MEAMFEGTALVRTTKSEEKPTIRQRVEALRYVPPLRKMVWETDTLDVQPGGEHRISLVYKRPWEADAGSTFDVTIRFV